MEFHDKSRHSSVYSARRIDTWDVSWQRIGKGTAMAIQKQWTYIYDFITKEVTTDSEALTFVAHSLNLMVSRLLKQMLHMYKRQKVSKSHGIKS
jgi:hypothetical protein